LVLLYNSAPESIIFFWGVSFDKKELKRNFGLPLLVLIITVSVIKLQKSSEERK
jgi:hypothetical protein